MLLLLLHTYWCCCCSWPPAANVLSGCCHPLPNFFLQPCLQQFGSGHVWRGGARHRHPTTTHESWRSALLAPTTALERRDSPPNWRIGYGRRPAPGRATAKSSPERLLLWATGAACACCTSWAARRRPAWRQQVQIHGNTRAHGAAQEGHEGCLRACCTSLPQCAMTGEKLSCNST